MWLGYCVLFVFAGALEYIMAQHFLRKHVARIRTAKFQDPTRHTRGRVEKFLTFKGVRVDFEVAKNPTSF